eukprot:m51a1_g11187 hypothetical protein (129) ;mRNA; r:23094-23480
MFQVKYQGDYGIINMRVFSAGSVVVPATNFSHGNLGSGWVSLDFDGNVITKSGSFDALQFAYQRGYGIVNVRLHKVEAPAQVWDGWMTEVVGDIQFTSDLLVGKSLHSIYTWHQKRYGIVDARSCVNL